MEDTISRKRESRIKKILVNNKVLIGILILAFAIRLYYFFLTSSQTVWWDEAEYLSTAKHWALNVPYDINPQRPILLPLLESIFLVLGSGEALMRFFLVLLPSIGAVVLTYLIGKEMFDKKIGLIASAVMGGFWLLLFNTTRLHVEAMLLFFTSLSIFCFWKGFIKGNNKYKLLTGLFLGLSFLTKFTAILTILSIILFLVIVKRKALFKDKFLWLSALIAFLVILPYVIWSKIKFGSFFIFLRGSIEVSTLVSGGEIERSFGWHILKNIPHFTLTLFFILFLIGLISLYKLILSLDLVLKNKSGDRLGNLFLIVMLLINLIFFIFIQRTAEDRWLMPIALPLFLFVAVAINLIHKGITKLKIHKTIALIIILILLSSGIYSQINKADDIIKTKKNSYLQVKEAALWMKENTHENDIILTYSGPQTTYYAEREFIGWGTQEEIWEKIRKFNPKYATISIFEKHPEWVQNYVQSNPEKFVPVQALFLDKEKQQLALVIYEINVDN